jgi:hypothetical protein
MTETSFFSVIGYVLFLVMSMSNIYKQKNLLHAVAK